MNLSLGVSVESLLALIRPTWNDVLFGMENDLLERRAPIDLALHLVEHEPTVSKLVLELAGSVPSDSLLPLVSALAASESPQDSEATSARWLYIALAYIYERRDQFDDPLAFVETLYADFDYPEEIEPFVRYMPMDAPDLGSVQRNVARLYERWGDYVATARKRYLR